MDESIWTKLKEARLNVIIDFGPNLIYAVVALIFGIFMIKFTMRLLLGFMRKSHIEPTLKTFIQSLSIFILYDYLFLLLVLFSVSKPLRFSYVWSCCARHRIRLARQFG